MDSPLIFEPFAHVYTTRDGRRVPSVTQILRVCGQSTDFEGLSDTSDWRRKKIDHRRDLGSAVHADTHAWDDNDLDTKSVHPDVLPFLGCWSLFRLRKRLTPVLRERILFHHGLWYCGTTDGLFRTPDFDGLIMPDLKIGNPEDAAAQFQTAGYELAYRLEHPDAPPIQRWSVQLTPGEPEPYRITVYDDYNDLAYWSRVIVPNFYNPRRRRTYGFA